MSCLVRGDNLAVKGGPNPSPRHTGKLDVFLGKTIVVPLHFSHSIHTKTEPNPDLTQSLREKQSFVTGTDGHW
jgi:hypothetical protein